MENILFLKKNELNRLEKVIKYYSFEQAKKDGDKRKINAPENQLKKIQRRILDLLSPIIKPDWVISGSKGKCYIDNGRAHRLSNYMLKIDIKKFYDNCERESVFNFFFLGLKISRDIAGLLSDIVTYEKRIPTGCPTSQIIAYYAYESMFHEIKNVALKYNCIFTLYVDDMTFSSQIPFEPKKLTSEVEIILRKYNHKTKRSKVKYYSKDRIKLTTGVAISREHDLLVPNRLQNKIYDNFMSAKKQAKADGADKKLLLSLDGQLQAAHNINPTIFPEITRLSRKVQSELKLNF